MTTPTNAETNLQPQTEAESWISGTPNADGCEGK